MGAVDIVRDKTRKDLDSKLNMYGKCALVRCTGFGKTWTLASLTKQYNKVLYLYPAEVIKNTVLEVLETNNGATNNETRAASTLAPDISSLDQYDNITFMTYMKLIRLSLEEIDTFKDYDLIIFDECHRIGADRTSDSVRLLFNRCSKAKFVGATATPERVDAYDVIEDFFDNIVTYEYTLHNAFKDGIIKQPYYSYMTYDIETDLKEAALTAGEDINNLEVKDVLKSKLIEISNIYNMDNNIREVINEWSMRIHGNNEEEALKEKEYMKFIVFFDGLLQLDTKGNDVCNWFKGAFTDHDIQTLTISSRNKVESDNVNKLDKLAYRKNGIDLIFCVDMLNMGYHVNDLTGVVMYRGTSSSIIYIQQLGRALSTGSDKPCIVIDVVDNLHRKNLFCINERGKRRKSKKTGNSYDRPNMSESDKEYLGLVIDKTVLTESENKELTKLIREFNRKGLDAVKQQSLITLLNKITVTDKRGNKVVDTSRIMKALTADDEHWWSYCNNFMEQDLIALKHEAKYREIIAKTVAEPIAQRCRIAQEAHYRRWCIMNNTPYPSTKKELADKNLMPPLQAYAAWQNVTVAQILDHMGIA